MFRTSMASHMHHWANEYAMAKWLLDLYLMFGCRSSANFATRGSRLICWLVERIIDMLPERAIGGMCVEAQEAVQIARELQQQGGSDGEPIKLAFINCFIDDFPMLAVEGAEMIVLGALASVLQIMGVRPQGKKVFPEGEFTQD